MNAILSAYGRAVAFVSGNFWQHTMLLFTRIVLAGIFWRAGRTKVEEGSWLSISDTTYFLFAEEYAGVPLPSDFAAVLATVSEHAFPILLVAGLFTRFSALALLVMTIVIQFFVYPEAWWSVHSLWAALALVLIVRGGGMFSLDAALLTMRRA
ncbi:DoxX family protein [Erythrobacter donghaensis]|jgi:putative oxidoreductase|uniref:DoxX family protein n=1 Tax=Erythrobacter donghaensis TaxID=267135 RepID=UPI000837533A|nr:DoxX family protein [Erythrobacter donghaensis]MBA4044893.1 DoxX family protein [Erythrobacter sp.]MBA4079783.1 DoxX family protein [Erythrobacter sp.]